MKTFATRLLLVAYFAQSAGCYQWVEVRPTELPKLNASEGEKATPERPPSRSARLERTDGSLLEIGRNADVRLETAQGTYDFASPVVARVVKNDLWIKAGNTGRTTVPLDDVRSAEVAKFDGDATALAIVGGVIGTALVGTLIIVYANWKEEQPD